jgi:biopolymer transport protein ExbB/TolQ
VLESVTQVLLWPTRSVGELVREGGPFVGGIFVCGFAMWTLVIERYWYFSRVLPRQAAQTQAAWQARGDRRSWGARQIRAAMVSRVNAAMSAGLPLLRVLVPLSPLLGLVGTVSGMLDQHHWSLPKLLLPVTNPARDRAARRQAGLLTCACGGTSTTTSRPASTWLLCSTSS